LTSEEAERRLATHGPNELPEATPPSLLSLLLSQFTSLLIWVLIGAAGLSGTLGEWIDAGAILAIVLLNGVLGFAQEYRAERSLAALKKLDVSAARVFRAGRLQSVPARDLVPGDLIQIEAGDHVPADARIIVAAAFQTQEAALTGESTAVEKFADAIPAEVPVADRRNIAFMGTVAVFGRARAIVVGTGLHTELGHIASLLHKVVRAKTDTPLQRRLNQFAHLLLWLSLGVVTAMFVLGSLRGIPPVTMFLTAVSLAVAAVPEGLPAVVTIALALGVTRMARRHALIRKLPVVETLGAATVICSDKTGTLTKNEMTVTALYQGGQLFTVTGDGYSPVGNIRLQEATVPVDGHPGLSTLLRVGVLCNVAELRSGTNGCEIHGDPTEAALLVLAAKTGLWKSDLEKENALLGEVPFDHERKKMTMVRLTPAGPMAFVKGAPDVLLQDCHEWLCSDGTTRPLTEPDRQQTLKAAECFAADALRVLGLAICRLSSAPVRFDASLERDLVFVGLVGMKDPIRPEAKAAIAACREAGITTVMITGDHKHTAMAIARELGMTADGREALSGAELEELRDEELTKLAQRIAVYARVSAEHKLRVVKAWKARDAIVAMTGDGINDAPAVKEADIGVAMGLTGTDVTKEASDIVVIDDNFATIESAVREGRAIYQNIRKAIHYLLSCNVSELFVMVFAMIANLPLPLTPVQILWINLVTDGLPALALAVEPPEPNIMMRPPRRPNEEILDRTCLVFVLSEGLFMAALTMAVFAYALYGMHSEVTRARTMAFSSVVLIQLVHALNCRSEQDSLFRIGVLTNPAILMAIIGSVLLQVLITSWSWTTDVFKVVELDQNDWRLLLAVAILPLLVMEGLKALKMKLSSLQ
jgi:Ca2+-transporting ATPase